MLRDNFLHVGADYLYPVQDNDKPGPEKDIVESCLVGVIKTNSGEQCHWKSVLSRNNFIVLYPSSGIVVEWIKQKKCISSCRKCRCSPRSLATRCQGLLSKSSNWQRFLYLAGLCASISSIKHRVVTDSTFNLS